MIAAYDPLDADSIRGLTFGRMLHTLKLRGVLSHEAVEILQAAHDSSVMAEALVMLEAPSTVPVTSCDACPFQGYREEGEHDALRWCNRRDAMPLGDETPGYDGGYGIPDACPLRGAPVRVEVSDGR